MVYEVDKITKSFKDEAHFQKWYIDKIKNDDAYIDCMRITSDEDTGTPDVLAVDVNHRATFIELKYEKDGHFKFTMNQPSWYKRHDKLAILIVGYRHRDKTLHMFDAEYALKNMKGLRVRLDE